MKSLFFYGAVSAVLAVASCAIVNVRQDQSVKLKSTLRGVQQKQTMIEAFRKRTWQQELLRAREECGVTSQTTSTSQRGNNCPASCPLYVQDKTDKLFCSFRCVQDTITACKAMNPKAPVPDRELGVCRYC